jgi:hypothetical protein
MTQKRPLSLCFDSGSGARDKVFPAKCEAPEASVLVVRRVGEWPAGERNAADGLSGLQPANLGDDALFAQLGHQQVEAAKLEITAEDNAHPVRLRQSEDRRLSQRTAERGYRPCLFPGDGDRNIKSRLEAVECRPR